MMYRGLRLVQAPRGIYVYEGKELEHIAGPFRTLREAYRWIDGHKRRQGDLREGDLV